jgi:hypothetical protein
MSPDYHVNRNLDNHKMRQPAFCLILEDCMLILVLVILWLAYIWPRNKDITMSTSSETLAQTNRKYWE